jgi:hypothetical protein
MISIYPDTEKHRLGRRHRFSEAERLKPDAASGAGHRKSRSAAAPKGAF